MVKSSTHAWWLSRWSAWVPYAASVWSLIYGTLGLYWALGGAGFPFGENDVRGQMMGSFLTGLQTDVGGTVIAAAGWFGAVASLAAIRPWKHRIARVVLLAYSWTAFVILVLGIPDIRVLQNFAYAFMLHFDLIDWPVLNQLLCMAGGFLWGAVALAYQRRMRDASGNSGRTDADRRTSSMAAAGWGRGATYAAIVLALPYGIVRCAWAAGIPLGTSAAGLAEQPLAGRIVEAILGGLPIYGAILTLGLIRPWGETFPRWCLFLAGKRVPVWFAVVPATLASALMTMAGLKISPYVVTRLVEGSIHGGNWGELGPGLFWLPWGVSLGFATLAYYVRRRGVRSAAA